MQPTQLVKFAFQNSFPGPFGEWAGAKAKATCEPFLAVKCPGPDRTVACSTEAFHPKRAKARPFLVGLEAERRPGSSVVTGRRAGQGVDTSDPV